MANNIDAVMSKIVGRGAEYLRTRTIMPLYVNSDFGAEVAKKGAKISVPVGRAKTTSPVTPGAVTPTPTSSTLDAVDIELTEWHKSEFFLSEDEAAKIDAAEAYLPLSIAAAFDALADKVNDDLFSLYKKVPTHVGTAGTTPFASDTVTAAQATKALNDQKAFPNDRALILSEAAWLNATQRFQNVATFNDPNVVNNNEIGRKLGFVWDHTTTVPTHTAGTITTGLKAKAATAQAIGTTAVLCTTAASTGACALKEGDVVTFSGSSTTYTLTADATQASANSAVTLNISPGLTAALAGGEDVTVLGNHVVNLAFHKGAFAFASRPLQNENTMPGGTVTKPFTDPVSGISFRLDRIPGYHAVIWEASILYGYQCIQPELAVRVLG